MKSSAALLLAVCGLLCARAFGEPAVPAPPTSADAPSKAPAAGGKPALVIQSTPALAAFAKDIIGPLHDEGIEVKLGPEAGNTQVVAALGAGEIDAALLTRPLKVEERAAYPEHRFAEITIGTHAVAMVVSRLVWEGGMRALKHDQIMQLYENKVRNWKELGGEDRPLQFFDPAHFRGPWEIFATWLYGDTLKAPGVSWQTVSDGADTQSALQFSSGGISVAAFRWIDRTDVFPLGILDDAGKTIEPTIANVAAGTYPLTRPVIIAFADEPVTKKKKLVEFLLGEKGQELVTSHDFIPPAALKAP